MFDSTVVLPVWIFVLLLLAAGYAVIMSVLFPSVRWYVRRRLNRAVDKLNTNLQIRIRPLQRTRRQVLIDQLMFDQEVIAMIEQQARQDNIPRDVLQQRVKHYAREIVPSFNAYVYYRAVYWIAKKLSRFIYRVRVAAADSVLLRTIDPDATVVFVMNHRSNMDYVLISYLAAERVTLSFAVGEWARIFPLDMLIRAMGAFFVRRGSQNPLYRKVLERYVCMATQSGVCQAVFLEGGLSRDGRMGEPKLGFLDYMLRNYDWQTDRAVVFVPVGINYDRVLEDQNMVEWENRHSRQSARQNLGKAWQFLSNNLFESSRARWQRFGYASVNFGVPISMREYCSTNAVDFKHLSKEQRIVKIAELANVLMDALRYVMPIIPVPVIASVLLRAGEESLTSLEIVSRCDELLDEMIAHGAAMKAEEKPRSRTLSNSLEQMSGRELVLEEDDRFRINPEHRALVQYYANSIAHWLRQADV
ncbi:MAG: 1-acyl-sn-glycerol-3-phosphate acyltransferase [Gammaproteobacteria bacterium]|nr:1-acyl-sn-glycerol-3-phosphate acyltransferase [Gammaproteobacteria bacterium]MDP2141809.1 1-acyl-sn-glycerol-3-phosphate acyltransferase [Gammaproteobacteria bacterium]MDP2348031.1 1-acyl-sn-glycerol-3-phosphate acyltransferase [Gammaproteobacteria bacterium]